MTDTPPIPQLRGVPDELRDTVPAWAYAAARHVLTLCASQMSVPDDCLWFAIAQLLHDAHRRGFRRCNDLHHLIDTAATEKEAAALLEQLHRESGGDNG